MSSLGEKSAAAVSCWAREKVIPFFFSEFAPDGCDEEVGEKDVEHVAIPGAPGAMLVVAHAEVGLVFEKALLDGPAKSRDRAEGLERGGLGSVGDGELHLSVGGC